MESSNLSGARPHISGWVAVLFLSWALLAARLGIALGRGESFQTSNGLVLAALAFAVTTAIVGSRGWSGWLRRRGA